MESDAFQENSPGPYGRQLSRRRSLAAASQKTAAATTAISTAIGTEDTAFRGATKNFPRNRIIPFGRNSPSKSPRHMFVNYTPFPLPGNDRVRPLRVSFREREAAEDRQRPTKQPISRNSTTAGLYFADAGESDPRNSRSSGTRADAVPATAAKGIVEDGSVGSR